MTVKVMGKVQGVITTNCDNQPQFGYVDGWVTFKFQGKEWLMSGIKATELKIELDHALKNYRNEMGVRV